MNYTQDVVTTLHDFGDADPPAPTDEASLIVPMSDRDAGSHAAERIFTSLSQLDLQSVVVPIRTPEERIDAVLEWLAGFDVPTEPIWCNGPALESLLAEHGLDGTAGKGLDVWVALGLVETTYVAVQDADVTTASPRDVRKLLSPLTEGYEFSKGYYARVENGALFGRLLRLLYEPLVDVLGTETENSIVDYLDAFHYALSGEIAATTELARSIRMEKRWGLEVGILGAVYQTVGADAVAQVDLGMYEHDHRAVTGPAGLSSMATVVADTLFRVVEDAGVELDYEMIADRYPSTANRYVEQYRMDARFNDLDFDAAGERQQVDTYADVLSAPGPDDRLPAWDETELAVEAVQSAIRADRNRVQ